MATEYGRRRDQDAEEGDAVSDSLDERRVSRWDKLASSRRSRSTGLVRSLRGRIASRRRRTAASTDLSVEGGPDRELERLLEDSFEMSQPELQSNVRDTPTSAREERGSVDGTYEGYGQIFNLWSRSSRLVRLLPRLGRSGRALLRDRQVRSTRRTEGLVEDPDVRRLESTLQVESGRILHGSPLQSRHERLRRYQRLNRHVREEGAPERNGFEEDDVERRNQGNFATSDTCLASHRSSPPLHAFYVLSYRFLSSRTTPCFHGLSTLFKPWRFPARVSHFAVNQSRSPRVSTID